MKLLNKRAISVIEYSILFVIIIVAFILMRTYIQRGIFGNWGQSGQSFAFGRQYDSQTTIECGFDDQTNVWYDHNCFEAQGCSLGDSSCEGKCQATGCNQMNGAS